MCIENQLTGSLDISNLFELEFFSCSNNQLSQIHAGINLIMSIFSCRNNNLSELNLSYCQSLGQVYADSNELVTLDLKNGVNAMIYEFHAEGNPNLYCIQVDDSIGSTNNPNWIEDAQSNYSESCGWAGISEIDYSNFKLLPNLASDWLQIEMDTPQNNQIVLSDLNGKTLSTHSILNKESLIDIRKLSNGIYLI
jgi:hypothetical protein